MSVGLYMDVHVPGPITRALLLRGVDVITAQSDDQSETDDPKLLDRATELSRVLVTNDRDFLAIGPEWQHAGKLFAGVLFADQLSITYSRMISDLELIGLLGSPEEFANRVTYLPLGGKSS